MNNGITALNVGIAVGMEMATIKEQYSEKDGFEIIAVDNDRLVISFSVYDWKEQFVVSVFEGFGEDNEIKVEKHSVASDGTRNPKKRKSFKTLEDFKAYLREQTAHWNRSEQTTADNAESELLRMTYTEATESDETVGRLITIQKRLAEVEDVTGVKNVDHLIMLEEKKQDALRIVRKVLKNNEVALV